MNTYRGIIKGNTIVLDEKTDLPDGITAQIVIIPLKATSKKIIKEQISLMEAAPNVGKILYNTRDELHER